MTQAADLNFGNRRMSLRTRVTLLAAVCVGSAVALVSLAGYFTVRRDKRTDQASKSNCLGSQVGTYGISIRASRQVAFVEDEKENGEYTGDT